MKGHHSVSNNRNPTGQLKSYFTYARWPVSSPRDPLGSPDGSYAFMLFLFCFFLSVLLACVLSPTSFCPTCRLRCRHVLEKLSEQHCVFLGDVPPSKCIGCVSCLVSFLLLQKVANRGEEHQFIGMGQITFKNNFFTMLCRKFLPRRWV